jgi:hypothetical protein
LFIVEPAKKLNESLQKGELEKFNFSDDSNDAEVWEQISAAQQKGILDAIKQI